MKLTLNIFVTVLFASGINSCGDSDDSGASAIENRSGTRLQLTGKQVLATDAVSDSLGIALLHGDGSHMYNHLNPGTITISVSKSPNEDFLWARVFDEIELDQGNYTSPRIAWLDNALIFSRVINNDDDLEITNLSPLNGSINWQIIVPGRHRIPEEGMISYGYPLNDGLVFVGNGGRLLGIGKDGQIKSNYYINEYDIYAWTGIAAPSGPSSQFFLQDSRTIDGGVRLASLDIHGNSLWAKEYTFPEYSNEEFVWILGQGGITIINENIIFIFLVGDKILLLSVDSQSGNPQWSHEIAYEDMPDERVALATSLPDGNIALIAFSNNYGGGPTALTHLTIFSPTGDVQPKTSRIVSEHEAPSPWLDYVDLKLIGSDLVMCFYGGTAARISDIQSSPFALWSIGGISSFTHYGTLHDDLLVSRTNGGSAIISSEDGTVKNSAVLPGPYSVKPLDNQYVLIGKNFNGIDNDQEIYSLGQDLSSECSFITLAESISSPITISDVTSITTNKFVDSTDWQITFTSLGAPTPTYSYSELSGVSEEINCTPPR